MKFWALFIIIYFISAGGYCQPKVLWDENRTLHYSDFKMKPPASAFSALSSTSIEAGWDRSGNEVTSFYVKAAFNQAQSWMRTKTELILAHEQLHFNITEYFARLLYSDLNQKMQSESLTAQQANSAFQQFNKLCNDWQDNYDKETEHGVNSAKQLIWISRLDSLLNLTKPYPRQ
jgi:hypothetical protein